MIISVRKYINKYWCPIKLKKRILVSPTPPQYCNSAAMGNQSLEINFVSYKFVFSYIAAW